MCNCDGFKIRIRDPPFMNHVLRFLVEKTMTLYTGPNWAKLTDVVFSTLIYMTILLFTPFVLYLILDQVEYPCLYGFLGLSRAVRRC